jgi:hypothetical protein
MGQLNGQGCTGRAFCVQISHQNSQRTSTQSLLKASMGTKHLGLCALVTRHFYTAELKSDVSLLL